MRCCGKRTSYGFSEAHTSAATHADAGTGPPRAARGAPWPSIQTDGPDHGFHPRRRSRVESSRRFPDSSSAPTPTPTPPVLSSYSNQSPPPSPASRVHPPELPSSTGPVSGSLLPFVVLFFPFFPPLRRACVFAAQAGSIGNSFAARERLLRSPWKRARARCSC